MKPSSIVGINDHILHRAMVLRTSQEVHALTFSSKGAKILKMEYTG
jgi:hypothetical protein